MDVMPPVTKGLNPLAVRVGEKIRGLRKAKGLKQDTLAYEAGYGSRSAIASIETGFVLPSLDKAVDIARVLGVDAGDLLKDAEGEASREQSMESMLRLMLSQHTRDMPLPLLKCMVEIAESLNAFIETKQISNSQYYFRVFHAS